MSAMMMHAWTPDPRDDTGEFPAPGHQRPPATPDRLTTRHHPLYILAGFGVCGALIALALWDGRDDEAHRALVLSLLIILGGAAAGSLISALVVRAHGLQNRDLKCSLKRRTDQAAAEVLTRIGEMERQIDEACKEMASRLGDHAQEMQALIEGRLVELERRIDEQDKKIDDVVAVASVFAQPGNGQVRHIYGPNGNRRPT